MTHITESIQGATANVSGEITGGLDYSLKLGHVLTHSDGETGSGTGNYANGDYYLFFTGADSYSGIATVSGDTITLDDGTYFIQCQPTFGDLVSTAGNTEARMQFVDQDDNPLGNSACINRDTVNVTYPAYNVCVAYVEGPATVKLKFIATPTGTFPKNGTESNKSPFFLEIMRIK